MALWRTASPLPTTPYIYKEGNQFLRTWFRLEEAVAAIFAAVAVRDYNLDNSPLPHRRKPSAIHTTHQGVSAN